MFLRYAFPSFVMTRMLARRQFEDGYGLNRSDDAFNRCFLVCISPGNKENHQIIQQYLDDMGFVPGEWLLCSDLKVNNICCGLMGHSAKFPCYACSWESGKEEDAATLLFLSLSHEKSPIEHTMQTYAHTHTHAHTHARARIHAYAS